MFTLPSCTACTTVTNLNFELPCTENQGTSRKRSSCRNNQLQYFRGAHSTSPTSSSLGSVALLSGSSFASCTLSKSASCRQPAQPSMHGFKSASATSCTPRARESLRRRRTLACDLLAVYGGACRKDRQDDDERWQLHQPDKLPSRSMAVWQLPVLCGPMRSASALYEN